MTLRVGIDVGGTFTDVSAFDEDQRELVAVRKYLSDPAQPAAVMENITADLARDFGADSVSLILHGSTAALNTLLEGKGVRVGLLTTHGFRDVYEIGRQWRGEDVFNIFAPAPKMLLTRDRIFEVRERVGSQGEVIEPLVVDDVGAAVSKLVADGVEAVAVWPKRSPMAFSGTAARSKLTARAWRKVCGPRLPAGWIPALGSRRATME